MPAQAFPGDGAVYNQLTLRPYFSEYKYLVDMLGMAQDMQALARRTLLVPNNYAMAQVGRMCGRMPYISFSFNWLYSQHSHCQSRTVIDGYRCPFLEQLACSHWMA